MPPLSRYQEEEERNREERREYLARSKKIADIIRPIAQAQYTVDMQVKGFLQRMRELGEDHGGFELVPDFQRGHVWTREQQQHYVESFIRNAIPESGRYLQFNCPHFMKTGNFNEDDRDVPAGFQCIDGVQRITAMEAFFNNDFTVFSGMRAEDFNGTTYSITTMTSTFRVGVHAFNKKADVLKHYLDINAGGTPHSPEEIARIREMLSDVEGNTASTPKPR